MLPMEDGREQMFVNLFQKTSVSLANHRFFGTSWQVLTWMTFKEFNQKYYVPNNAVLVVAGDIAIDETKKMIQDYFGPIPKGNL